MKFDINNINDTVENSYTKEEKEEFYSLKKKYNLNDEKLKELIKNVTIYSDFDDVIVDLFTPWVKDINKRNKTNYKREEVKDFFWFSNLENGMEFLQNENLYQLKDENQKDLIKLRKDVIPFFKELERNGMLSNVVIVTSTYEKNYISKKKYIKDNLSNYLDIDNMVTTSKKYLLSFDNAILIDDGSHNVVQTVMSNPYATAFVLNQPHNESLYTGKRIKRINSLKEVLVNLPLTTLRNYDRHFDFEKQYLREETLQIKSRQLEEEKKKQQLEEEKRKQKLDNNNYSLSL
mgnify:CR=1 FL=1